MWALVWFRNIGAAAPVDLTVAGAFDSRDHVGPGVDEDDIERSAVELEEVLSMPLPNTEGLCLRDGFDPHFRGKRLTVSIGERMSTWLETLAPVGFQMEREDVGEVSEAKGSVSGSEALVYSGTDRAFDRNAGSMPSDTVPPTIEEESRYGGAILGMGEKKLQIGILSAAAFA